MTFDDLSVEYSEAGMAILNLLGKRQMSIITVLAGWCRASLLKFNGMVTEAVSSQKTWLSLVVSNSGTVASGRNFHSGCAGYRFAPRPDGPPADRR